MISDDPRKQFAQPNMPCVGLIWDTVLSSLLKSLEVLFLLAAEQAQKKTIPSLSSPSLHLNFALEIQTLGKGKSYVWSPSDSVPKSELPM